MTLGRVIGCVWATAKDPGLVGQRMLLVQPVSPELKAIGRRIICLDAVGAGAGELVYWTRGKEASFPFLPTEVPVDTTIVGIVDSVHVEAGRTQPAPAGAATTQPPSVAAGRVRPAGRTRPAPRSAKC